MSKEHNDWVESDRIKTLEAFRAWKSHLKSLGMDDEQVEYCTIAIEKYKLSLIFHIENRIQDIMFELRNKPHSAEMASDLLAEVNGYHDVSHRIIQHTSPILK